MRKNWKKKVAIVVSIVLVLVSIGGICIFNTKIKKESKADESKAVNEIKDLDLSTERDTKISVSGGQYKIERTQIESTAPMGEDKWTIFVYMSGADLEALVGQGSSDIQEMINAQYGGNVRMVVQTGGTFRWKNDKIDPKKFQRFLIDENGMEQVDEKDIYINGEYTASMGNPDEFYDFISWGINKYGSSRMGLIFWDHGATALEGLCFDMNCKNDYLSLGEVELALNKLSKKMTDKFEFIGLDCCEMQSIEMANAVVPYADYLIGSESSEGCNGWYYTDFINYLEKNKDTSTEELGKVICDSCYEHSVDEILNFRKAAIQGQFAMSVIDLSKVDEFLYEFHNVCKDLDGTVGKDNYYDILGRVFNSAKFNIQYDLGNILENIKDKISSANGAIEKYNNMVKYFKMSDNLQMVPNATGVGVVFRAGKHFSKYVNVCVNPYYLDYMSYMSNGSLQARAEKNGKSEVQWENSDKYYPSTYEFLRDAKEEEEVDVESGENLFYILDKNSEVKCVKEPQVVDNSYCLTVDTSSMDYIADAEVKMFRKVENEAVGESVYIEISSTKDISMNKETGEIKENVSGKCLALPNGLLLNMELVSTNDEYERYVSKCYINDEYVKLYTILNKNEKSVEVEGYSVVDNSTLKLDKGLIEVQSGDKIEPMFNYTKDLSDGKLLSEEDANYGYYNADSSFKVSYCELPDDTYYCVIVLKDVYGNDIYTKDARYTMENGTLKK